MSTLKLFTVDSFTSKPFTGNPAAVCLDDTTNGLPESLMQKIAAEMNISETAFVCPTNKEDSFKLSSHFDLRWFTPTSEVPLCGHATLATAATLFHCVGNENAKLTFATQSGELTAVRDDDKISLDLPLNPPQPVSEGEYAGFENLVKEVLCESKLQEVQYSTNTKKLLLRLADTETRETLENLKPSIQNLTSVENSGKIKGVIVTLKGSRDNGALDEEGKQYDFISRYFAPWVGIPEDPVTGAAHTVLSGYWSKQLEKHTMYARQCSARGGELHLVVKGDRLLVSGYATVVLRGELTY